MPIYEYRCGDCGRKFESIVLGSPAGDPSCPRCGGGHVERLASRFAAVGSSKTETDEGGDFGGAGLDDEGGDFGGAGLDDEGGWDEGGEEYGGEDDWSAPEGDEEGGAGAGGDGDDEGDLD